MISPIDRDEQNYMTYADRQPWARYASGPSLTQAAADAEPDPRRACLVAGAAISSDRQAYLASLELMRDLDFDVLLPWTAGRGGPWHAMTDKADAGRRIDAIIDRLRGGDDH
jgi:hypothetical protein